MRTFIVASILLAAASTARAESPEQALAASASPEKHGDVSVGVEVGNMRTLATGYHLDGSRQLSDLPLFVHGRIAAGTTGTDGSYQQVRGGVDARQCVLGKLLCGFAGVDVGYRHDHVVDYPHYVYEPPRPEGRMEPFHAHDVLAVPRVGLELGAPVRLRAAVELPMWARVDEADSGRGVMFTVDMGYAF